MWTVAHLTKLEKQQPHLVANALQTLVANNPDLSWSLVVTAYLDEEINLGKAAELLELPEMALRERFMALGIPLRIGSATVAEARAEAEALASWFATPEHS
jgi:predicted HTH domain antitoxin